MSPVQNPKISFTCFLIPDPQLGGFTAFFSQFPNVIAEGESEEEAIQNLVETLQVVLTHESKSVTEIKKSLTEHSKNYQAKELEFALA